MPSSNVGLHTSHIYFMRSKLDREAKERAYNDWLTKRAKTKQSLIDQIESIKQGKTSSKRSHQLLERLEYQLATMESDDAEEADPEFLKNFPNAHKCHRPAYVKLAFENAIAESEKVKKIAEEAYREALSSKEASGDVPAYMLKGLDPTLMDVAPPPPLSPESSTSSQQPKQSKLQKLTAYLAKLENSQGMTKTFPTRRTEGTMPKNSKWDFSARTYYPSKNVYPSKSSPSS